MNWKEKKQIMLNCKNFNEPVEVSGLNNEWFEKIIVEQSWELFIELYRIRETTHP